MDFVTKSVAQAVGGLVVATVFWLLYWVVFRLRRRKPQRWSVWLGLHRPPSLRLGLILLGAFLAVGVVIPALSHWLVPGHDAMAATSPQFKIAQLPPGSLLAAALAYAFLMTGFTEELLFRGLLGKRLIHWLGEGSGNVVQAALFALLHVVIVYAAVPQPGLPLVAFAAIFPGLMGWVLGWAMIRDGGSIFAPWMAHAATNLATVLVYVVLFD